MLNERHSGAGGSRRRQNGAGQPAARRAGAVLARAAADCSPILNSPISLAFLERYPSPADARGLGEERLAGVPGPRALLRSAEARRAVGEAQPRAPEGRFGELEHRTRRQLVLTLVATIKTFGAQITRARAADRDSPIREHPDGEIFLSLFNQTA